MNYRMLSYLSSDLSEAVSAWGPGLTCLATLEGSRDRALARHSPSRALLVYQTGLGARDTEGTLIWEVPARNQTQDASRTHGRMSAEPQLSPVHFLACEYIRVF